MRALAPFERGAFLAFAQVRAQRSSFGCGDRAFEPARERELGLAARQAALELLAQRAAGAEEQGLDGAHRRLEDRGDLGVRATLELAHDDCGALVEAQLRERVAELRGGRDVLVGAGGCAAVAFGERDFLRPAGGSAEALAALVVRDLDQPVVRLDGPVALPEG